jgi:hypothetical protein
MDQGISNAMYGIQADNDGIPMQPTPPPPSLEMLHGQVTWLTEKMEALEQDNATLKRELDWNRREIDRLRESPRADKDEQKGANPPTFTGTQKELEGWITACRLSFANQPSKFRSDAKKIVWATTFLSGPPLAWLQPAINKLLTEGEATPPELETFETFVQALKGLYGDPNLQRNAKAALRNLRQITSVAEYHSRFASHGQYTGLEDAALADYFYLGLKPEVKDRLADLDEWTSLRDLQQKATRIDARLQERRVEKEREARYRPSSEVGSFPRGTNVNPTQRPTFIPAARPVPVATPRNPPVTPVRPMPATDGTTPMELDSQRGLLTAREKEECLRRGLCFHCKGRGHISALCPNRTRIAAVEMEMQLSENDGAQE